MLKKNILLASFLLFLAQFSHAQVTADFAAANTSGCGPLIVQFNNLSTGSGTLTYSWNLGNGNTSSIAASDRSIFRRQTYLAEVDQLKSVDPTGRFVYVGAFFSAEGSDPYSARTSYAGDLVLGLGWPTFSPVYEDRKVMMGLTKNLVASLAEQENLYYVLNPTFIDSTTRLFSEIYGEQLHFEVLGGLSSAAATCQIRPV